MMRVLFIGGTGLISTAVSKLAIQKGFDLTIMNRGQRPDDLPKVVHRMICDIHDEASIKKLMKDTHFDAVVDWIAFTKDHVERDYRLFKGHTRQYVFISSASAYQKPVPKIPITEDEIPLDNPFWPYSKNKQMCEEYLLGLNDPDFPVTIIRPSHTYNDLAIVAQLNSWQFPYTLIHRMKHHKPIIIPDQGTSLWTLTYNGDFAHAFLDVLGNKNTYQDVYHLTSDKVYSWLEIHHMIEEALGLTAEIIFIPTEDIIEAFPEFRGPLLGDMKDSVTFDNTKIKQIAPHYVSQTEYADVVKKAVLYFESHPEAQVIDESFDARYDQLIKSYRIKLKQA